MSITSIASSGMHVAALRQDVAASNIARSLIPGAPRQSVAASALPDGGVSGSVVAAGDDTDAMATDLVYSLVARNDFQANALVLSRSDQMIGTLLDKTA
jgi:flagellar hook-associated protein FlgK